MFERQVCVIDKDGFYVDFIVLDMYGKPVNYELKDGHRIVETAKPDVAVNGVLYCDEQMLCPKWSEKKQEWVEAATKKERAAAVFVPGEVKPTTEERLAAVENAVGGIYATQIQNGLSSIDDVPDILKDKIQETQVEIGAKIVKG